MNIFCKNCTVDISSFRRRISLEVYLSHRSGGQSGKEGESGGFHHFNMLSFRKNNKAMQSRANNDQSKIIDLHDDIFSDFLSVTVQIEQNL